MAIFATQPKESLSIFEKSKDCKINPKLIAELKKFKKTMKCMTLLFFMLIAAMYGQLAL